MMSWDEYIEFKHANSFQLNHAAYPAIQNWTVLVDPLHAACHNYQTVSGSRILNNKIRIKPNKHAEITATVQLLHDYFHANQHEQAWHKGQVCDHVPIITDCRIAT